MRLIDGDELKTAFPCGENVRTECVRATIDHMPTVDAVPVVHSRWIEPVPGDDFPYCGNCKAYALDKGLFLNPKLMDWHKTKYCPNCAAKMDLEE